MERRDQKGWPPARQIATLRSALLAAITEEEMDAIIRKLVERARAGDIAAAKEVILRTLGRPVESDLLERLERVEEVMAQAAHRGSLGGNSEPSVGAASAMSSAS